MPTKLLRRSGLALLSVCLAFAQTEEQYRRFIAHIQNALALKAGAVVADIGTGESPEQPLHMAKAVGASGKIICIDIDEKALEKLRLTLNENRVTNVQIQLGKPDDPLLPPKSVDSVLIAFAYHHFVQSAAMLAHIRTALRPEGRLVIIEAISGKNRRLARDRQVKDHELSPEILRTELQAAGFEIPNGMETLVDGGGVLRYLFSARSAKD
jgi:ubiquinone/menaquinone biosynthesis C-methylase UbiE